MRHFFALFLAVAISAQAFYNAGVMGYWVANRAYIAVKLCENRNKPASQCNGKCYLKKKLSQSTHPTPANDQSEALHFKKGLELADFTDVVPIPGLYCADRTPRTMAAGLQKCCGRENDRSAFHPPPFS